LDAVPAGYRTYVSNNEERFWRSLKHSLGKNYQTQDAAHLIHEICKLLQGWTGHKDYEHLYLEDVPPLNSRYKSAARPSSERLDDGSRHKALTVSDIKTYATAHGAANTYLEQEVRMHASHLRLAKSSNHNLAIAKAKASCDY
jgi:hypothetical protein